MARILSSQPVISRNYQGQQQDPVDLPKGFIAELIFNLEATYDVAVATVNPHPAGLANALARIEIFREDGQNLVDLSGHDLHDLFRDVNATSMDNTALHPGGASATGQVSRMTLRLPFELLDGADPQDTILESVTSDVKMRITYNNPTAAGTLYGTVTGLANVSFNIRISAEMYRMDDKTAQEVLATGSTRIIRAVQYAVTQTNDAFVLNNLPRNEVYRGVVLAARSTVGGVVTGSAAIIDPAKEASVKSSKDNNTYQKELVRVLRGRTLQRRGLSTVPAGVIDVPFIRNGRAVQAILSTVQNELSLEIPAVNTGTTPHVRVITDIIRRLAA